MRNILLIMGILFAVINIQSCCCTDSKTVHYEVNDTLRSRKYVEVTIDGHQYLRNSNGGITHKGGCPMCMYNLEKTVSKYVYDLIDNKRNLSTKVEEKKSNIDEFGVEW